MVQTVFVLLATMAGPTDSGSEVIDVPSMLLRLVEQVEVPAREAGVLKEVLVHEGQMVKRGDTVSRIADSKVTLAQARAKIEVEVARKKAGNDVNIRFAKKSVQVAEAELARAQESVKKYPNSVSDSEIDRLRLTVERATLEIEQAERELELFQFIRQVKENELASADADVERRMIAAPISGMVVQVHRQGGEWVEPGEKVIRIIRIDRLRAEGFLPAHDALRDLDGKGVTMTVDLPGRPDMKFPGKIVFISPEVDPVNSQVRIWAEIENRDLMLRPGLLGKLKIHLQSD